MPATSEKVMVLAVGGTAISSVLNYFKPIRSVLMETTTQSFALISDGSMFQQMLGAMYVFLILSTPILLVWMYFRHKEKMREREQKEQNSSWKTKNFPREKGKRKKQTEKSEDEVK